MTHSTDQQDAELIYGPMREAAVDAVAPTATDDPHERSADVPGAEVPLLNGELERGIASIFAALHSAADGTQPGDSAGPDADEVDVAKVDMSTLHLLGELDRLWHRA